MQNLENSSHLRFCSTLSKVQSQVVGFHWRIRLWAAVMGGGFGYRRPEQGHDGLGLRVRAVPLCQSICETQLMFSKKKQLITRKRNTMRHRDGSQSQCERDAMSNLLESRCSQRQSVPSRAYSVMSGMF